MPSARGTSTSARPGPPPAELLCPQCTIPLNYRETVIDDVGTGDHRRDRFTCRSCGGSFEYRPRMRRKRILWKCPACQMPIRHDRDGPHPHCVYRCHVCRVELVPDEGGQYLTVAPLPSAPET
jgi:hypothetical protein